MTEQESLWEVIPVEPASKERAPLDQRCGSYPYTRADGVPEAQPLFQAAGGGSIPTSALQLQFDLVGFHTARQLVALWHSRLPNLHAGAAGGLGFYAVCYVAEFDGGWYAVAIWTSPIALNRMNVDDPQSVIELRRFAIAEAAPKNTASRMLGFMVRDLFLKYPRLSRCISYQDTAVHDGTIYKASGWRPILTQSRYVSWNSAGKGRGKAAAAPAPTPKTRWERHRAA